MLLLGGFRRARACSISSQRGILISNLPVSGETTWSGASSVQISEKNHFLEEPIPRNLDIFVDIISANSEHETDEFMENLRFIYESRKINFCCIASGELLTW